jgi:hypothetical protein
VLEQGKSASHAGGGSANEQWSRMQHKILDAIAAMGE